MGMVRKDGVMKRAILFAAVVVLLICSGKVFAEFGGGSGTLQDPYLIYTKEHLLDPVMVQGQEADLYVKLMDDIDFDGQECPQLFQQWFLKGVFDGNHKSIKNIHMVNQTGFVRGIYYATLKNLTLENPTLVIDQQNFDAGLLMKYADANAIIDNCHVINGYIDAVSDYDPDNGIYGVQVAGLAWDNSGIIRNSSFSGTITGTKTFAPFPSWSLFLACPISISG